MLRLGRDSGTGTSNYRHREDRSDKAIPAPQ
jgi:hypothetical protein